MGSQTADPRGNQESRPGKSSASRPPLDERPAVGGSKENGDPTTGPKTSSWLPHSIILPWTPTPCTSSCGHISQAQARPGVIGRQSCRQTNYPTSSFPATPGASPSMQHCSFPWQAEKVATDATILRRRISRSCILSPDVATLRGGVLPRLSSSSPGQRRSLPVRDSRICHTSDRCGLPRNQFSGCVSSNGFGGPNRAMLHRRLLRGECMLGGGVSAANMQGSFLPCAQASWETHRPAQERPGAGLVASSSSEKPEYSWLPAWRKRWKHHSDGDVDRAGWPPQLRGRHVATPGIGARGKRIAPRSFLWCCGFAARLCHLVCALS